MIAYGLRDEARVGVGLGDVLIGTRNTATDPDPDLQATPSEDHEAVRVRTRRELHRRPDSRLLINPLILRNILITLLTNHINNIIFPSMHNMGLVVLTSLPHLHLLIPAPGRLPHPHICRACPFPHLASTLQLSLLLSQDTLLLCLSHPNNLSPLDNITFLLHILVVNMVGPGVLQGDKTGDENSIYH